MKYSGYILDQHTGLEGMGFIGYNHPTQLAEKMRARDRKRLVLAYESNIASMTLSWSVISQKA
jgi:hypothetical protein